MTRCGTLNSVERLSIADQLPPCSACGQQGLHIVHSRVIGTGQVFLEGPLALAICSCGQNQWFGAA